MDVSVEDTDPPNNDPVDLASPGTEADDLIPLNIDVVDDPEDEITEVIGVALDADVDCVTTDVVFDTETAIETAWIELPKNEPVEAPNFNPPAPVAVLDKPPKTDPVDAIDVLTLIEAAAEETELAVL